MVADFRGVCDLCSRGGRLRLMPPYGLCCEVCRAGLTGDVTAEPGTGRTGAWLYLGALVVLILSVLLILFRSHP